MIFTSHFPNFFFSGFLWRTSILATWLAEKLPFLLKFPQKVTKISSFNFLVPVYQIFFFLFTTFFCVFPGFCNFFFAGVCSGRRLELFYAFSVSRTLFVHFRQRFFAFSDDFPLSGISPPMNHFSLSSFFAFVMSDQSDSQNTPSDVFVTESEHLPLVREWSSNFLWI